MSRPGPSRSSLRRVRAHGRHAGPMGRRAALRGSREPPDRRPHPWTPYGHAVAWKRAVFALFVVAAGTNVPTPLLLVYQERLDLSAEVLTALFGCYAAGLVPALLLAGQLSDRLGRPRGALPRLAPSGPGSPAFARARATPAR